MKQKAFLDSNFLIYLNAISALDISDSRKKSIEPLYRRTLKEYALFANGLVLDEVIHISKIKYNISYEDTLQFLKQGILPFALLISIDLEIFNMAEKYMITYKMKPSDSIHAASMESENIKFIVTEDSGFDALRKQEGIERIWL